VLPSLLKLELRLIFKVPSITAALGITEGVIDLAAVGSAEVLLGISVAAWWGDWGVGDLAAGVEG